MTIRVIKIGLAEALKSSTYSEALGRLKNPGGGFSAAIDRPEFAHNFLCFFALDCLTPVGLAMVSPVEFPIRDLQLGVFVDPAWRRKKVGQLLVNTAAETFSKSCLRCHPPTAEGYNFFLSFPEELGLRVEPVYVRPAWPPDDGDDNHPEHPPEKT